MAALDVVLESIGERERLRVWSVIITFFGDAIVPRGGAVSARSVTMVMERLGIGEGAVRTAFSRLAADGWVQREKIGRVSHYRLAPQGAAPFESASVRIYAPVRRDRKQPEKWLFATRNMEGDGTLQFEPDPSAPGPWLLADPGEESITALVQENCLVLTGDLAALPQWIKELAASASFAKGFRQLMADFEPLAAETPQSGIEAIAARCLLIHAWRRLLLRLPDAPAALQPDDWPADEARIFVGGLYHRLLPLSEGWLDQSATGPSGRLQDESHVGKRFR